MLDMRSTCATIACVRQVELVEAKGDRIVIELKNIQFGR
jgi:hypothetical protein